jgi:4-carboxymuconolactone decarboxylase
MTPEQQRVYQDIVRGARGRIVGPLRAALHRAELADKWQQLGELLRYRTGLAPRLSELAILITARFWDSQFEWYAHESVALETGLPPSVIIAIKHARRPEFASADDEIVYEYSAELLEKREVCDAVYRRTLGLLSTVGIVELTALIGYYSMVALTLNAHRIPLPPEVAPPLPARATLAPLERTS